MANDRAEWLDQMLATGDWSEIRKLNKGVKRQQGRLKDFTGKLVNSEEKAKTLANHFKKIQWVVRPMTLPDRSDHINAELPIGTRTIKLEEVACLHAMPFPPHFSSHHLTQLDWTNGMYCKVI